VAVVVAAAAVPYRDVAVDAAGAGMFSLSVESVLDVEPNLWRTELSRLTSRLRLF
jgi:hypothetical protein